MKIQIKKLYEDAKIPTRGSEYSAGYDLYAHVFKQIIIPAHSNIMIKTGVSFSLPPGTFGGIFARSGLASKQGLRPANCVGVVDSDYRGEVMVALHNDTDYPRYVKDGDRIAQFVIMPFVEAEFEEVETLDETDRGSGGFGSTGTN